MDYHLYYLTKAVEPLFKNDNSDNSNRTQNNQRWRCPLHYFYKMVQQLLWGNTNGNPHDMSFVLKLLNFSSYMRFFSELNYIYDSILFCFEN